MYASVGSTYMADAMKLTINAAISGALIFVFVFSPPGFSSSELALRWDLDVRCNETFQKVKQLIRLGLEKCSVSET